MSALATPFQCPPDCGWCCTHLHREVPSDEAAATKEFRAILREQGVYHCTDAVTTGLSLSNQEAEAFLARGATLHPRTYLLDAKRRLTVVLDWHLPKTVCPFYADFKCTIYGERPLVCRAFPVMISSPLALAPECPKVPAPPSALRVELRARRAIDRAHAALDDVAQRALAAPGLARGLSTREAGERARRYRTIAVESYLS